MLIGYFGLRCWLREALRSVVFMTMVCTGFLTLGVSIVSAEEPLTNASVIALTKAGLAESIIVEKVRQAPEEQLDISTEALILLGEEKVGQATVEAIMARVLARTADRPAAVGPRTLPTETPPQVESAIGESGAASAVSHEATAPHQPSVSHETEAPSKKSKWKVWQRGSKSQPSTNSSTSASATGDSFLRSDDFKEGEEIVNVYFKESEYALIREEFEFRGVDFDWAWVKGEYSGRKGKQLVKTSFNISDYSTARVVSAGNFSPSLEDGLEDGVKKYFGTALKRLGLTIVEGEDADLELGVAIVDYKADKTYAFVAMIDPFIELEVRLRDLRSGEDLVLIRNQDHNNTPLEGAGDTAASLMRILQ